MSEPKRRKPGDRTARLESQAAAAWARENARITAREVDAPVPLPGLGALAPGRKRAYAEAMAQYQADCHQAMAVHARAEQQRLEQLAQAQAWYEQSLAADRERVRRQHAAIDQMASDFAAGQRKAVADFFAEVLALQSSPGDFPSGVKIAYKPVSQDRP